MKFVVTILLCLLIACPAQAASNYIDCTFPAITNALATAQEGDIIKVAPGTCVISNGTGNNRAVSFTFIGSGSNQTTLISAPGLTLAMQWSASSTNPYTIGDFNMVGAAANSIGFLATGAGNEVATRPCPGQFIIRNIQMTNVIGRGINLGNSDSHGVLHDSFFDYNGDTVGSHQPISIGGNSYRSWTNDVPYGTTNCVVIENCTIRNKFYSNPAIRGGNGGWDGYYGGSVVLRSNVFDGPMNNGTHGYDSGATSFRSCEIYDNIFTNQLIASGLEIALIRGGGLIMYSNRIYMADTTNSYSPIWLNYYRATCTNVYTTFGSFNGYDTIQTYTSLDNTNYRIETVVQPGITKITTNNMVSGGTISFGDYTWTIHSNFTAADRINDGGYFAGDISRTLTNLALALNATNAPFVDTAHANSPGYGTAYSTSTHRSRYVYVVGLTSNSMTLRNRLDGTNDYGYPAGFQPGVIKLVPYTNSGVEMFPCYAWENKAYGSNGVFIQNIPITRAYEGSCVGTFNSTTNIMIEGRDYFNEVVPTNYTALVSPHPLNNGGGSEPPPDGGGTRHRVKFKGLKQ